MVESFFSSLKKERIKKRVYKTRDLARADIFDYIEGFYNRTRRHSRLGGISPQAFEKASSRGSEVSTDRGKSTLATRSPMKRPAKATKADAKAAPVAKPAKKRASKKSAAAAKHAPSCSQAVGVEVISQGQGGASRTKQLAPPKSVSKAAATGRVAKEK